MTKDFISSHKEASAMNSIKTKAEVRSIRTPIRELPSRLVVLNPQPLRPISPTPSEPQGPQPSEPIKEPNGPTKSNEVIPSGEWDALEKTWGCLGEDNVQVANSEAHAHFVRYSDHAFKGMKGLDYAPISFSEEEREAYLLTLVYEQEQNLKKEAKLVIEAIMQGAYYTYEPIQEGIIKA